MNSSTTSQALAEGRWPPSPGGIGTRRSAQGLISICLSVGIFGLAVLTAVVSAWQGSREIHNTLLAQSMGVATSLAGQNTTALLADKANNTDNTDNSSNSRQAMHATLAFPGVMRLSLHDAQGEVVWAHGQWPGKAHELPAIRQALTKDPTRETTLLSEDDEAWQIIAPVWARPAATPGGLPEPKASYVGHVQLVQSKATLSSLKAHLLVVNLLSALVMAALIQWPVRVLARRLTRSSRRQHNQACDHGHGHGHGHGHAEQHVQHVQPEGVVMARNMALQEACDKFEAASLAKSAFLARMSHELRTPLNAILGYAQVLRMEKGLSDRVSSGIRIIQHSGEHLVTLVADILDLSRIESGKTELKPVQVSLPNLIGGVVDIVRVKAQEKGLHLALKADPELPNWVMVDDKRLRQVLLNLLGNAVKFTPSGHVCLSVTPTKASDHDGTLGPDHCSLRFEVLDSGPGISDQDQARIFEPFEQAGDAHSQAQGTGLGLAIAQQLTRLMGGEIQLSSQAGQGSLFWFDLSLPICHEQAEAAASSRLAPVIQGHEGPRRCVLVVDDAAIHRQMLVDMLEPLGFQTRQAADGIEALEQVMARRPDLILMDQDMPLLDGLQATQQLRHLPLFQNANQPLPIVILSDQACGTAEPSALGSGADAYLAKPVHRQALLDVLGRCLGLRWV